MGNELTHIPLIYIGDYVNSFILNVNYTEEFTHHLASSYEASLEEDKRPDFNPNTFEKTVRENITTLGVSFDKIIPISSEPHNLEIWRLVRDGKELLYYPKEEGASITNASKVYSTNYFYIDFILKIPSIYEAQNRLIGYQQLFEEALNEGFEFKEIDGNYVVQLKKLLNPKRNDIYRIYKFTMEKRGMNLLPINVMDSIRTVVDGKELFLKGAFDISFSDYKKNRRCGFISASENQYNIFSRRIFQVGRNGRRFKTGSPKNFGNPRGRR